MILNFSNFLDLLVRILDLNYIILQKFTLLQNLTKISIIWPMRDVKRISSINRFLNFVTEVDLMNVKIVRI